MIPDNYPGFSESYPSSSSDEFHDKGVPIMLPDTTLPRNLENDNPFFHDQYPGFFESGTSKTIPSSSLDRFHDQDMSIMSQDTTPEDGPALNPDQYLGFTESYSSSSSDGF